MHRGLAITLGTLLLVLTGWGAALAQQFATTEDEILKGLTTSRSLGTATTRSMTAPRTRTIAVVKREDDQIVQQTITVNLDDPAPHVNLRIQFDYDSFTLRPESYQLLANLASALKNQQLAGKSFLVKGHTCSLGSESYNLNLSLNRAHAVRDVLVGRHGVDSWRLQPVGYGPSMPLVPNSTSDNMEMNRRVEVQVVE